MRVPIFDDANIGTRRSQFHELYEFGIRIQFVRIKLISFCEIRVISSLLVLDGGADVDVGLLEELPHHDGGTA